MWSGKNSYARDGTCINEHGKGVWVTCEYNMRESGTIKFWTVDIYEPTRAPPQLVGPEALEHLMA